MSEQPTCGKCRKLMTPENSTACPEYFLCDDCAKEHGFEPRVNFTKQQHERLRTVALEVENTELRAKIARAQEILTKTKERAVEGNTPAMRAAMRLSGIDDALKELHE